MEHEVPFREAVAFAIGGGWGHERPVEGTVPVAIIRGTDFARLAAGDLAEIPRRYEGIAKVAKRTLRPRDVVLEISGGSPTSGQSTGRSFFVTERTLAEIQEPVIPASFCRLVRFDEEKVDPRYAYYVLQDMYLSGRAADYEHRSTGISNFQFEYFLDQETIRLIPLAEQRAIAHILGTLDDKIELNRRMSETLEAMARDLFKSWFVDFDQVRAKAEGRDPGVPQPIADLFPSRFEDSELGEIPVGWRIGRLGDVLQQRVERCEPSGETASRPYVPIECITPRSLSLVESRPGHEAQSSLVAFRKGDLLFGAMRPYFHKVCIAPFDGTTRTTAFVLVPVADSDFSFAALLLSAGDTVDYATRHSRGSTIPYAVWRSSLEDMPAVVPAQAVRAAFDELTRPMLDRLASQYNEHRTLVSIRDSLLPKLVSGEIRVRQVERVLEAAPA